MIGMPLNTYGRLRSSHGARAVRTRAAHEKGGSRPREQKGQRAVHCDEPDSKRNGERVERRQLDGDFEGISQWQERPEASWQDETRR